MSRIAAILVIALVGAAALILEPPRSLDPEVSVASTVVDEVPDATRFSHCAWAFADGDVETTFAVAAVPAVEYRLSFPQTGELTEGTERLLPAGAAVGIELASIRQQGDSPAIVEFDDGPTAVAVVAAGDTEIAAANCPSSLPKVWHLPGGTTADPDEYVIRLMNPFADDARVDLSVTSELGSEAAPDLQGLSIPARTTRIVDMSEALPGRSSISVTIDQVEGSVIPMAQVSTPGDIAVWEATRQSETWEFPLVDSGAGTAVLTLSNSAPVPVTYTLELFGEDATVEVIDGGIVPGPGQVTVPVADLGVGPFGIRVSGDGPMAATVTERGESSVAITPGAPTVSSRWLLPGPNAETSGLYRLWLMNSGIDTITVEYRFLDAVGGVSDGDSVELAPGATASVAVTDAGTAGMILEAGGAFSAGWSATFGDAVAFSMGIPIGE